MSQSSKYFNFRKADSTEVDEIWTLIQQAIIRRKNDGSNQWQDGYPNRKSIQQDIEKNFGFVLASENKVIGYAAILFEIEPAYEEIQGKWLSNEKYVVIHRVAISDEYLGQGLASKIFEEVEKIAVENDIYSIKVDTNFDNSAMLKILEKLKYAYCGEVYFRGSARKAFEKILQNDLL